MNFRPEKEACSFCLVESLIDVPKVSVLRSTRLGTARCILQRVYFSAGDLTVVMWVVSLKINRSERTKLEETGS